MKAGQFVKAVVGNTTEAYDSKGVTDLLSETELTKLYNRDKAGVFLYLNKNERVIAKSTVTQTSDGERVCLKNHTVIVKFDVAIEKDGLTYHSNPQDINAMLAEKIPQLDTPFPELKQPLAEVPTT